MASVSSQSRRFRTKANGLLRGAFAGALVYILTAVLLFATVVFVRGIFTNFVEFIQERDLRSAETLLELIAPTTLFGLLVLIVLPIFGGVLIGVSYFNFGGIRLWWLRVVGLAIWAAIAKTLIGFYVFLAAPILVVRAFFDSLIQIGSTAFQFLRGAFNRIKTLVSILSPRLAAVIGFLLAYYLFWFVVVTIIGIWAVQQQPAAMQLGDVAWCNGARPVIARAVSGANDAVFPFLEFVEQNYNKVIKQMLDLLQIDFAEDIVKLVTAAFGVALAIAFGVGGIDAAKQWWAKYGTPGAKGRMGE